MGDYFLNVRKWLENTKDSGVKLGFENCNILLERLGNPHLDFPSIHVAGTNGKGSLCVQLSAAAKENNLKVGLFTSPHLITIEERIRVNGVPVSPKDFDTSLNKIKEAASISPVCKPTFFEVTFLLAMVVFSENNIDRAIIETGLGGRLDSTRLVDADLCVITTISKDHTEFLGETLEEIAFEKAGIHRPGVPLLLSKSDSLSPSVLKVISDKVGEDLWIIKTNEELSNWQKWSMLTRQIAKFMKWKDSEIKCKWPGRSPEYGSSWYDFPVKVCAAHNKEGFESELNSIEKPSVFIIGITEKADIKDTLSPFLKENLHQSIFHHLIFTEPLSGRNDSVNAEELENIICRHRETPRDIIKNPINAIEEASKICEIDDVELVIIGSVYLVGDILNYIISRDNLNFWEELRVHR